MIDLTNREHIPIFTFSDEPLLVSELAEQLHKAEEGSGLVIDQVRFWPEHGRSIGLYVDGRLVANEDYAEFIENVEICGLLFFLNLYEIRASTAPFTQADLTKLNNEIHDVPK